MTADLEHIVSKARDAAAGGFEVQSTGEKLTSALALNRADWLAEMGCTLAEAIERVGPAGIALIPQAARILAASNAVLRAAAVSASGYPL